VVLYLSRAIEVYLPGEDNSGFTAVMVITDEGQCRLKFNLNVIWLFVCNPTQGLPGLMVICVNKLFPVASWLAKNSHPKWLKQASRWSLGVDKCNRFYVPM